MYSLPCSTQSEIMRAEKKLKWIRFWFNNCDNNNNNCFERYWIPVEVSFLFVRIFIVSVGCSLRQQSDSNILIYCVGDVGKLLNLYYCCYWNNVLNNWEWISNLWISKFLLLKASNQYKCVKSWITEEIRSSCWWACYNNWKVFLGNFQLWNHRWSW